MRPGRDLTDIFHCPDFQNRFSIDRRFEISGPAASELSGTALTSQIGRAAAALRRAGLTTGDLVLFQGPQGTDAFILFWAAMLIGAVFTPIDLDWPDYLFARATEKLQPKIVVAAAKQWQTCRRCFPKALRLQLCLQLSTDGSSSDLAPDEYRWQDWLATAPNEIMPNEIAVAGIDPSAAAVYLFTSGSTGTPKAVILSRSALAQGAAVTLASFKWHAGERLLNLPEPHTMSGLRNAMIAAPLGGLTWIPMAPQIRPNLFALIDRIKQSRCQHLVVGPAIVRQLVLMGDRLAAGDLAGVKAIYCTGATLNAQSAQTFFDRYRIPIINYYGLTETGGICLSRSPLDWDPADTSLGIPVGCAARLKPVDGKAAADIGELQISSPQLMSGYLDDPARSAARFDEERCKDDSADGPWLKTGDVMRRDETGRYHLLGRTDLFIKTAATERVHPEELELVLERHPAVADVAVTSGKTDFDIERIVALVVPHDPGSISNALATELSRFVVEHLGANRAPNEIRFVATLPRLDNGKLARSSLATMVT